MLYSLHCFFISSATAHRKAGDRGGAANGGMTVNLRMLRHIDQGEEVEAADEAVSGERQE